VVIDIIAANVREPVQGRRHLFGDFQQRSGGKRLVAMMEEFAGASRRSRQAHPRPFARGALAPSTGCRTDLPQFDDGRGINGKSMEIKAKLTIGQRHRRRFRGLAGMVQLGITCRFATPRPTPRLA